MNKIEVIKELKKYNLDIKRYIIISGTAMVLHGLKSETPDIDISITPDYEEELLEDYLAVLEHINPNGTFAYMIDDIINFGVNYYSEAKEYIDGFPVQSIDDIIKLKEFLNREKDRKDLKLLYKRKAQINNI